MHDLPGPGACLKIGLNPSFPFKKLPDSDPATPVRLRADRAADWEAIISACAFSVALPDPGSGAVAACQPPRCRDGQRHVVTVATKDDASDHGPPGPPPPVPVWPRAATARPSSEHPR